MARYEPAESVYPAAQHWAQTCLLAEGSVFTDESLWNKPNFSALDRFYVQNLDEGEGNFFGKLEKQLAPAPAAVKRLAAEVFWVMYLFPSDTAMNADTKRAQINKVWSWSGEPLPDRLELTGEVLNDGIGHPGTAFNTHRWREFLWFILAMTKWFDLAVGARRDLLADPWDFAEWVESTPQSSGRQMRHIILHLLFPDTFERMSTASHKRQLVTRLGSVVGIGPEEIDKADRVKLDKQIFAIRRALAREHGEGFDFYQSEVRKKWQTKPSVDVDVASPPQPKESRIELDSWLHERFGAARVWAIGPGASGQYWPEFVDEDIIAIGWDHLGDLEDYDSKEEIEASLQAEQGGSNRPTNNALACYQFAHEMREGDVVFAKRGRSGLYGYGIVRSDYRFDETRDHFMHVRDVEWKATGEFDLPKDQWIAVKTLTELSDYPEWVKLAVDLMEGKASVPPQGGEVHEAAPVYERRDALNDLFIAPGQFDEMQKALLRTKALILTGAPGVGKTFVSRRLAWSIMRRRDEARVRMVQFHQSYAYEDFVQGWRPTESGGFTLRNGVFYGFCEEARADGGNDYVFIIDEINRANLSKVFGELLMLIEADKREPGYAVQLAYAPTDAEPFFIPENVYIIGLMNTADRSLALVDYALRRRFSFINLRPAFERDEFQQSLIASKVDEELVAQIVSRMTALNAVIAADRANLGPGFEIGHSYFVPRKEDDVLDREWYERVIRYEIEPLLEEYWFDQPEKVAYEVDRLLA